MRSHLSLEVKKALKDANLNAFLKLVSNDVSLRDYHKKVYLTKEDSIPFFTKLFKDIRDINYYREDSHYICEFKHNNKLYISKIKINDKEIYSIVIEEKRNTDRIVLEIEYNGYRYYGMERQKDLPTIQGEIEKVLSSMLKEDITIMYSSRTDRGVHAKKQLIHFDYKGVSPERFMYYLNKNLPEDIRIKKAYIKSQLFHTRYDVVRKEYEYIISLNEINVFDSHLYWYKKVDNLELVEKEFKKIIGTHDFLSFSKGFKESTIRTIYKADIKKTKDKIIFKIAGDGFLHNMIRLIVGELIVMSNRGEGDILKMIEARDKNQTKFLAPASGLYLIDIKY